MSIFDELNAVNVNDHTEKKNGLTYLSWSWAWGELMKRHPEAVVSIREWDGKPYLYDENLGYLCEVSVTIGDETRTMWLPVMDGSNKAMKNHPYTIKTRYGEKTVEAATMFDINTTIMRCLVKCISLFGLGLYIYAGEDLPEEQTKEEESKEEPKKEQPKKRATKKQPAKQEELKKEEPKKEEAFPEREVMEREILMYYNTEAAYKKFLKWAGVETIGEAGGAVIEYAYKTIQRKKKENIA